MRVLVAASLPLLGALFMLPFLFLTAAALLAAFALALLVLTLGLSPFATLLLAFAAGGAAARAFFTAFFISFL
jgi:hypothetical protein